MFITPEILILAITMGSLWAGGALATQFILGTMGRIHMALGHWFVLSALLWGWMRDKLDHVPFSVLLLMSMVVGAVSGRFLHPKPLLKGILGEGGNEGFFVITLGSSLILEFLTQRLFPLPGVPQGPGSFNLGENLSLSIASLQSISACLALGLCSWAFLRGSKTGLALRAWNRGSEDLGLVGVDSVSLAGVIFPVALGIVFLFGAIAGSIHSVNFHEGFLWTASFLFIAIASRGLKPIVIITMGWVMGIGEAMVSQSLGPQWQAFFSPLVLIFLMALKKGNIGSPLLP